MPAPHAWSLRVARAIGIAVAIGVAASTAPKAPAEEAATLGPPEVVRGLCADSLGPILDSDLAGAHVGLLAVSLEQGDTLAALHESLRFIPASAGKVFALGALLDDRGADARGRTVVEARGKVRRGKGRSGAPGVALRGDLVLRPCGMPDVVPLLAPGSKGLLDSLAQRLRESGLVRFEGTLWVDTGLFAEEPPPPGWAHDDLAYSYGAPLNSWMAYGNAATVIASESAGAVALRTEPAAVPLTLRDGGIAIGTGEAAGRLSPRWIAGTRTLELTGVVPQGGVVRRPVAMADPDSAVGVLFLDALRREGVSFGKTAIAFLPPRRGARPAWAETGGGPEEAPGRVGAIAPDAWRGMDAKSRRVVAGLESPTVAEAIRAVAAQSLNMETEGIVRLLDARERGKEREAGLAAIGRRLAAAGIDSTDVSFVDGAGLSPIDLATPRALVRWLEAMERGTKTRGVFRGALPAPGDPGTMVDRLRNLPAGVTVRAKSGSLSNVSTLVGYVATPEGEPIVFCMMVNAARRSVAGAKAAQERFVRLLARVPRDRSRWGASAFSAPPRVPR